LLCKSTMRADCMTISAWQRRACSARRAETQPRQRCALLAKLSEEVRHAC
jgi:hypothetical protein